MSKVEQRNLIDTFLQRIKIILQAKPELLTDQDRLCNFLYTQLISFSPGKNKATMNETKYLFQNWIDRNNSNDNLNTFVAEKYPNFCQIVNKDAKPIADIAIKLYVPLDEQHLYEGVNILFDFVDREKIIHNSKIGPRIRNDNVVLRVSTMDEAEKIIEFVGSNSYIQEGLLSTNPFTLNINGVGIAKDGQYSYNGKICEIIANVIIMLNKNNKLDALNVDTLEQYVSGLKISDPQIQTIINIIKANLSKEEFSLNDFKRIVNAKSNIESNEEILKFAIRETSKKYGLEHLINALARFRYNGDTRGFTRENGARHSLSKISINELNEILSNSKIKSDNFLEDYIKGVLGLNKIKYLLDAYTQTMIKYGSNQASRAMYNYIASGDAGYFTNDRNVRAMLKENIKYEELRSILINYLSLDDYCTNEELATSMMEKLNHGEILESTHDYR